MSGTSYIKCNKCGNQYKIAFLSMGSFKCECGANDYLMDANSKTDNKPEWWIENKSKDGGE